MSTQENKIAKLRVNRTNAERREAHRLWNAQRDREPVSKIKKAILEGRVSPPYFGPI